MGVILVFCYVSGTLVDNGGASNYWMHAFFAGWVLYPVAFWMLAYENLTYNLLDVYSKGAFGLVLAIVTFSA